MSDCPPGSARPRLTWGAYAYSAGGKDVKGLESRAQWRP